MKHVCLSHRIGMSLFFFLFILCQLFFFFYIFSGFFYAQELVRRLLNTSSSLPQEKKNEILRDFIRKARRSGYNKTQTKDIVMSGLKGYRNKWENLPHRHRSREETDEPRRLNKLTGKTSWFKTKPRKRAETDNDQPRINTNTNPTHKQPRPSKPVPTIHQQPSSLTGPQEVPWLRS